MLDTRNKCSSPLSHLSSPWIRRFKFPQPRGGHGRAGSLTGSHWSRGSFRDTARMQGSVKLEKKKNHPLVFTSLELVPTGPGLRAFQLWLCCIYRAWSQQPKWSGTLWFPHVLTSSPQAGAANIFVSPRIKPRVGKSLSSPGPQRVSCRSGLPSQVCLSILGLSVHPRSVHTGTPAIRGHPRFHSDALYQNHP